MSGYIGNTPPADLIQDTKKDIYEYTATAGQTLFVGYDTNSKFLDYTAGLVMIALNGVWLDAADYTADNGTSITLTTGAILGASLKVLTFDSYDVINTYTKKQVDDKIQLALGSATSTLFEYTATEGQTTFSGIDDNAVTLAYAETYLLVIMNGVVLDTSEYTATDTTSVVLTSAAKVGDIVNIFTFGTFNVANTYSKEETDVQDAETLDAAFINTLIYG